MRNQKRSFSTEGGDSENNKRLRTLDFEEEEEASFIEAMTTADSVPSKPKPHITGIKKQSRYDPGVSMNRDELKAWRKEARRVRNRESAAASRKKNRERVTELEIEVEGIKAKYAAALQMIIDLEANRSVNDCVSFTPPALLRQDLLKVQQGITARPDSPEGLRVQTVSPPQSPSFPPSSNQVLLDIDRPQASSRQDQDHDQFRHKSHQQHQHITMISRPIACV